MGTPQGCVLQTSLKKAWKHPLELNSLDCLALNWPQLDGYLGRGSHGQSEQLRQNVTQLSSKSKMQNTEQGNGNEGNSVLRCQRPLLAYSPNSKDD